MDGKNEIRDALRSELTNAEVTPIATDQRTYETIRAVLAESRTKVVNAINSAMVQVYWEIGREINEAIGERAEYGKQLLQFLAKRLTAEFGKGFTVRNLRNMRQFYQTFPIRHTLCAELSWSHYRLLMAVEEPKRREFYYKECADGGWTVRQLERQKYSVLADKENLYAANYLSYLPTEEELKAKLEFERKAIERRLLLEKNGGDDE